MYGEGKLPESEVQGLRTLFNWLGQEIGDLNPASIEKIKIASLAYVSIGLGPSFETQGVFDIFHAMPEAKERAKLKPPTEVMDFFDRLFASEAEIKEKREHDFSIERARIKKVFDEIKSKPLNSKDLKHKFSEKKKVFWGLASLWLFWVVMRTKSSFELVGYDFHQWDDDMFIMNVVVFPFIMWIGNFFYKRYFAK
jgi:hypothetical protein